LKAREKEKQQTIHIEDMHRLVTEIQMLKVVWRLLTRRKRRQVSINII
jgi:hypothetical protein